VWYYFYDKQQKKSVNFVTDALTAQRLLYKMSVNHSYQYQK